MPADFGSLSLDNGFSYSKCRKKAAILVPRRVIMRAFLTMIHFLREWFERARKSVTFFICKWVIKRHSIFSECMQ